MAGIHNNVLGELQITWGFKVDNTCMIVTKYGVVELKNLILTSIITHNLNYNRNAIKIVRLTVTACARRFTLAVAYVLRALQVSTDRKMSDVVRGEVSPI